METRLPAEVFPPGDFLLEELEARGWSQADLAGILGRSRAAVNEIVTGRRRISPDTAKGLAEAFGTSAELWLNLETTYQLWWIRSHDSGPVARRSKLYGKA